MLITTIQSRMRSGYIKLNNMKIYTVTTTCDLCGCEGAANLKTASANWIVGNFVSHSDIRVCKENLKRDREAALAKQISTPLN